MTKSWITTIVPNFSHAENSAMTTLSGNNTLVASKLNMSIYRAFACNPCCYRFQVTCRLFNTKHGRLLQHVSEVRLQSYVCTCMARGSTTLELVTKSSVVRWRNGATTFDQASLNVLARKGRLYRLHVTIYYPRPGRSPGPIR